MRARLDAACAVVVVVVEAGDVGPLASFPPKASSAAPERWARLAHVLPSALEMTSPFRAATSHSPSPYAMPEIWLPAKCAPGATVQLTPSRLRPTTPLGLPVVYELGEISSPPSAHWPDPKAR